MLKPNSDLRWDLKKGINLSKWGDNVALIMDHRMIYVGSFKNDISFKDVIFIEKMCCLAIGLLPRILK